MIADTVTFLAALIAGGFSLVAITLSKEQKVSEFRQAWIDELRADLAAFLSSARAIARAMNSNSRYGSDLSDPADPAKKPFTIEKIGELRSTAAETYYRIKLRLNTNEPDHKELLRLMQVAIDEQNEALRTNQASEKEPDILKAIDCACDFAGPVLKEEWKRVKDGEGPYKLVRRLATVIVIASAIAFLTIAVRKGLTEPVPAAPAGSQK